MLFFTASDRFLAASPGWMGGVRVPLVLRSMGVGALGIP